MTGRPTHEGTPADHVTPYDRIALPESALIGLLATGKPNTGLVEYFGAALHAELAKLARATRRRRRPAGRRVYVLPGIMGSQLGLVRGENKPNDILWLDPIDIAFGRLKELRLPQGSRVVALGAMNYTYLKLTLSLRKAGYDAVLLDYDWRQPIATLGKQLAERLDADGRDNIAFIGHSMGGLVARAAMTHDAGKRVSQLVMLGTPNGGSLAAVQALRGTYSVVRKIAMLDLRHDAEYLASHVFATFPGLHELVPANRAVSDLDLFDAASWPASGPAPDARLLADAAGLERRMAPADSRFIMVVGCNRTTATGVAIKGGDFEYEYSLQGDGTVPMELARLSGARHYYVECGHSDMPLADRVISGTLDLLTTGATQHFAAAPPVRRGTLTRVGDAELRQQYQGKVDWPHMTPEQRRLFLDTLNEAPKGRAHRKPQRSGARPLLVRVVAGDVSNSRAGATAVAVLRGVPASGAAADIDARLGGVIADWLQHRVVSGDAGNVTPIPRALQRPATGAARRPRGAYLLVGLGRFDRLSLDVIEHAAENLARFAEQPHYRSLATVAWGSHSGIAPEDSFTAQLRGLLRARAAGQAGVSRIDLHVLTRADAQRVHARLADFVKSRPAGSLRLAALATLRTRTTTRSRRVPGTAHLIVSAESTTGPREIWRASLLTGGTSAAIFSQSQEVAVRDLEKLDREFLGDVLTAARVKQLGEKLARLTLHPDLARALLEARGQAVSVVHDAAGSRVPWETLNLRGWCPALDGGLSRRYATADLVPARFDSQRRETHELGVLIIANPTRDLPGAEAERKRIAAILGDARRVRLTEVVGEAATLDRVTAEFESGRYDVIHYAGHAFFDAKQPGESGLVLADGELTGAHLSALGKLPPLLMFNACESARVRRRSGKRVTPRTGSREVARRRGHGMRTNLSLAETLLRAGVAHYIGTHWPVGDDSATAFAERFYREVLRGSIGDALVKARRAVLAERSPDWADYVHYGDAEFRLKK
ncbi:MAG TPA: CHAT domain-containing protein [Steroidobacteraceae bacterium]|nr:CHAT domain-containing protein [Steroidobacteraceae bacterium]